MKQLVRACKRTGTTLKKPTQAQIILLVLLALSAAIYGSLLHVPQLNWDDDSNIFKNPYYLAGYWLPFWSEAYFGLYVPVTSFVWEVAFVIGGGTTPPFRVLNLLLHGANIGLVYLLLQGLARRWSLNGWATLIGVALFALHPLQVHTVAWISGGRDLLAAFFSFAALLVYFGKPRLFSLASLLFIFATLSKPSAVILPAMVLVLEVLFNGKPDKLKTVKLGIWFLLSVAVVIVTKAAQEEFLAQDFSVFQRAMIVLDTYSFYIQKFFFPYPLSANYARTPEAALADPDMIWSVLLGFGFLAGLGVLAWRADKRYSLIGVWMLALLPVSGIVAFGFQKISTVSDHYMYFPIAALSALTAFILSRIDYPKVHAAALGLLIPTLAYASYERTHVWRSDEAFFTDMKRTAPESYSTAMGMSVLMCVNEKNYDEGVRWTEIALKARPLDIMALANQAYCFLHARNYFRVIELESYLGQLDLDYLEEKQPTAYSSFLASVGTAYMEQQDYEDGFQFLCEAYRVKPGEPNHLKNLQIAAKILEDHKLNPDCETPTMDDEDPGEPDGAPEEPAQEVWPDQPADPDDEDEEPSAD